MCSLQFVGGSKPSQKPVTLVQLHRPVNTDGNVGALITVWFPLFSDYASVHARVSTNVPLAKMLVLFRNI